MLRYIQSCLGLKNIVGDKIMNKVMEYLLQLSQDDLSKYPGLMKKTGNSELMADPILWASYSLFHDAPGENNTLNLRNL
jgi:hypothetical protein